MKAEELMIGDWVKFPIGIEKIIDLPYIEGRGICASFAASATLFPVEVDKLEPILLTPEILEKNGFESDTNMFGFADYELSKDYILENRGDRFCISRRVNNSGSTYWILTIFFVHQLQHALRLCKIDKTIEL